MTPLTATEVRVLSLLLERALALPAEEREAFIAALPERQQVLVPRLRERMASLVQIEAEGADALPPPPPPPPPKSAPRTEVRVGPYRLLEPLGGDEGGRVWRAERGEGAARKLFALRLQPVATLAETPPARGEEMQVDLLPSHPAIVRLVDAGMDAQGRFYRVLPLIEGQGLVAHAQGRGQGDRAVAQLMLKLAQLVAFVHAEQVACSDLRTSSFRVDDESRVLLLDWGQGRALRAEAIAADVLGLGRVLQAVLAGAETGSGGEVSGRPARTVTPGPDMGRVLRRALREPGVPPYATVQEMVDDLRLIPDFRPVPGASGGALHLAQLFVRRNRLALGAGVLVAGLLTTVGSVGWRAYERGAAQSQRSDQVQVFLAEHLPGPAPGADGQPPDLAVEAPRLQRALETARFGFPGEPVLRGQVITALGRRFGALGQPDHAQVVLQEAVTLLQGTANAADPALHAARVALAQQLLQTGETSAPARAATLARQVLEGCSAGDACVAARNAAQTVLQQAGAGR